MAFGATHPSEEPVMRDDSVGLDLDFDDWREALGLWMAELEGDDPLWDRAKSRDGVVAILEALKHKLEVSYPNCAPLRRLAILTRMVALPRPGLLWL